MVTEPVVKTNIHELETRLKAVEAWQTGHFLLSSGLHSRDYIQCQKLLQYPRHGWVFAQVLADQLQSAGIQVQTVVGPALGAVHWEVLVSMALDELAVETSGDGCSPIRGIFAERPEGKFEIRRGIEIQPGEEILVVEDVTTTGGSARQVVELVRQLGGKPVAVGTIIDRSGGAATFDVPFFPLLKLNLETYQADACPVCAEGLPLVKPGTTKEIANASCRGGISNGQHTPACRKKSPVVGRLIEGARTKSIVGLPPLRK